MKKIISIILMIALVGALSFVLIACEDDEEVLGIDRFEITDLELTEGDAFDSTKAVITCYKTDDTSAEVKNNLVFDTKNIDEMLDEDGKLLENSAGTYIIPVYHLDIHIGDLKVIVSVKR